MQLIEIRLSAGLLLIGRPGAFPRMLLSAADQQRVPGVIRAIGTDSVGMTQLRKGWRKIYPAASASTTGRQDLVKLLQREIAAGRLKVALLREGGAPAHPVNLPDIRSGLINVAVPKAQLLIGRMGAIPAEFRAFRNPGIAADLLSKLTDVDPAGRQIDAQAGRLAASGKAPVKGRALRQNLAWQLQRGAFDAAVIRDMQAVQSAARRPDAVKPVDQMSPGEKVAEALGRSTQHLSGEIWATVEQMIAPESLAIMVGVFVVVAAAQLNPVTGAAVDTTLVVVAWTTAGLSGVVALAEFVDATIDAMGATSEQALDEAAKQYAEVFVTMGATLLAALTARFVKKGGGGGKKEGGGKSRDAGNRPAQKSPPSSGYPAKRPVQSATPAAAARKAAFETKPNEATFWSGLGRGGDKAAAEIAKKQGGKTLEHIVADRNIDMPVWDADNPASVQAWKDASRMFAEGAKGEVKAVLGAHQRADSIWNTVELPALRNNPNVSSVSVFDPETGLTKLLFKRDGP